MILFKTFLTLLKRDYKTLLIHFLVFAVFGTLVAVNNAKVSQNIFTDAKINVAVIDHDRSQLSEAVHRYIRDVQHEVDLKTEDPEKINDAVRFELAGFALIIPKGFSKDPGQNKPEYISNGHSASAALMDQKISVYIDDVNAYMESGLSQEEAIEKTDAVVRKDVRVDLLSIDQGKDKSFLYYLFAFAAYGLLMVMCESIGMVMSHLQESETRKRIDVSPYGFRRQGRELILGIVRELDSENFLDPYLKFFAEILELFGSDVGVRLVSFLVLELGHHPVELLPDALSVLRLDAFGLLHDYI